MATTYFVKLTAAQGQAAGKEIMSDARCNDDVKKAIRAGMIGGKDGYSYTCTGAVSGKQNQWYDDVVIAHGIDNAAK